MKPKNFVLPEFITFEGANHGTFRGALHAEFQRKQFDLVNKADKTKLGISDALMKAWDEQIKLEDEVNRRVSNKALTKQAIDKDVERDGYISALFGIVNSQRFNLSKPIHEAYAKVAPVVHTYRGLQSESLDEETAHIRGLEVDLAKLSAETATLGLTTTIASMHQANEEFRALRGELLEHEADTALPESKGIRQQNDRFFKVVCRYIEATHLLATVEADKQAIAALAERMNLAATKSRTTHNTSAAQREVAAAEEYEKLSKLLQPLFAALELERGMPDGILAFTGHKRNVNKRTVYELLVQGTKQLLWVRIDKDRLVEVKAPAGAAREARDTNRPVKFKRSKFLERSPNDPLGNSSSERNGEDPKDYEDVEGRPKD